MRTWANKIFNFKSDFRIIIWFWIFLESSVKSFLLQDDQMQGTEDGQVSEQQKKATAPFLGKPLDKSC